MKGIGWLLGLPDAVALDQVDCVLAAPWAVTARFWIFLSAVALLTGALVFYLRFQAQGSPLQRLALGLWRGALLIVLLLTLADPTLRISSVRQFPPLVCLLFDGTESMTIRDRTSSSQRAALAAATGLTSGSGDHPWPSRRDYLKSLLSTSEANVLERLRQGDRCRLEAYLIEGERSGRLRKLQLEEDTSPAELAEQLTTRGQVTALGTALADLRRQVPAEELAAVVVFSDFAANAGARAAGGPDAPASRLGAPLMTVGLGVPEAPDVSVVLLPPPRMKRAERGLLRLKVVHTALAGTPVRLTVTAQPLAADATTPADGAADDARDAGNHPTTEEPELVWQRTVSLEDPVTYVELPYTPQQAGRFLFTARAETDAARESVLDNNVSSREVQVIDDYLRLLYLAFEPTWEWRFIKEVFHRDPLVGMRGFRTFVQSSDPVARQANKMFLPGLDLPRADFFATDVFFVDDLPRDMLTPEFCTMLREYVSRFGGGLVVLAGPRFGPGQLAGTPLADMLPVRPDPQGQLRDQRPFRLRLTPTATQTPFMNLGQDAPEHRRAWENLGELPWYQPVLGTRPLATVLAEHPTERSADGSPQPLIAIRRYGRGQVVYLGFNEMWRLRRRFGERYYRQFWSQVINQLGLSHALGNQKRFVARIDRSQYAADDQVSLTVEAFDEQFVPLTTQSLGDRPMVARLQREGVPPGPPGTLAGEVALAERQPGEFGARIPVYEPGDYRLEIQDPIADTTSVIHFGVASRSAELRSAVRDVSLQHELAQATGGRAYELTEVRTLPDDLSLEPRREVSLRTQSLWSTPFWFLLVVGLMLAEWLCRKLVRLT
jgi:hypothetical protein